jgi:hypothetical protein
MIGSPIPQPKLDLHFDAVSAKTDMFALIASFSAGYASRDK